MQLRQDSSKSKLYNYKVVINMKIHESEHENAGWISVNKKLPPLKTKVEICCVNILDWNIESCVWKSTGWMIKDTDKWFIRSFIGTASLYKTLSEALNYYRVNKVTHWRPID